MLFLTIFNELKNFLFIDAVKNKNTHESVVMIIDNINDNHSSRIDMILSLITYYFNNNFDKYKTIYLSTMQPKNYIITISHNTIENYIDALLDIRLCDSLHTTFYSEIKLQQYVSKYSAVYIFSKKGFTGVPKVYFYNSEEQAVTIIVKNANHNDYISAEYMSYKDVATIPTTNKFHFKNKFIKFVNGNDNISQSPYDHDIFIANIIDEKFTATIDDNIILNLNEIENQKKLFSCLIILYIKFKTRPEHILNLIENSTDHLQLLESKYNFLKNELKKYINKNKLITDICNNLHNTLDNIIITNRSAIDFYNICDNRCVGISLCINAILKPYKFVYVSEGFTKLCSVMNYVKFLEQKQYNYNQHNTQIEDNVNFVLPMYINKSHWEESLKYITKIFPLIFTNDFSKYSEHLLNVYYSVLSYYSHKMFFTENIVNWDEKWVNCWISLFYTCYHISAHNKYYKGFEKFIQNKNTYDCAVVFGQSISINYKNFVMLYNIIEHEIISRLIHHIDKDAVGLKELIIDNDPNLITELDIAIKSIPVIKHMTESFVATSFVLAMLKDVFGGIVDICNELELSDGVVNENTTKKLYEYCETFRELETENKIQILVNKNKIPIENIFQPKFLCKKIKSHYQNIN